MQDLNDASRNQMLFLIVPWIIIPFSSDQNDEN
jgi:hypothetical protein